MARPGAFPAPVVSLAQGLYYAVTGLWPVIHMGSFEWFSGRKTDDWLVKCVGAMLTVQGIILLDAGRRNRVPTEIAAVAAGTASVLATVDIVYYRRGILRWVYLLDAVGEGVLVAGWLLARKTVGTYRAPPSIDSARR